MHLEAPAYCQGHPRPWRLATICGNDDAVVPASWGRTSDLLGTSELPPCCQNSPRQSFRIGEIDDDRRDGCREDIGDPADSTDMQSASRAPDTACRMSNCDAKSVECKGTEALGPLEDAGTSQISATWLNMVSKRLCWAKRLRCPRSRRGHACGEPATTRSSGSDHPRPWTSYCRVLEACGCDVHSQLGAAYNNCHRGLNFRLKLAPECMWTGLLDVYMPVALCPFAQRSVNVVVN